MTFSIRFQGDTMAVKFRAAMNKNYSLIARATTGAARQSAEEIKRRGKADIASAGKFGKRWLEGLRADVTPRSGALVNARIDVTHTVPYSGVFEFGSVIRGKPLLWIPLSYTNIRIRARDWARRFGGLFYVKRRGKRPLLLSIKDHKPKFFGISRVTIRKRFHIRQICRDVMRQFPSRYRQLIKKG